MTQDFTTYTDEALMRALDQPGGGNGAFTELYERHSVRLYHNILSLVKDPDTAEEVVQELFTRIWQKRGTLDLTPESNIAAYLYTICRNIVHDFFRKADQDKTIRAYLQSAAATKFHPDEIKDAEELARSQRTLLARAIEHLPPVRRRAFELCKLEGKSYQQAAEELGIGISTMKDHMAKAQRSIKDYLSKEGEIGMSLLILLELLG